ncbi:MAG: PBSX family phage terminase large subunit [Ruminococcus sp.]|nr:PBSX family phage terminase large subunit [Ruminococcus sp.]
MSLKNKTNIYLPDIIGKGYKDFWNFKGRYNVCKGSRASKKSKTTALRCIYNIMKYPEANLLVVRKTYRTLKDSCFAELKWAIHRLQVDKWWSIKESPLEMTYKPTGQKIYFRGLDDPLKITSITVDVGVLCWGWIEEAYEIMNEDDFNTLDESIRGELPSGLFKQWVITFNPWNEQHWLKRRFFDVSSPDILAKTTNYLCNEWLGEDDLKTFEDMKRNRPERYKVAGLGGWGVTKGVIFHNFETADLTDMIPRFANIYNGLDFGVTDPNALIRFDFEPGQKKIYVFEEFYQGGISLETLAREVNKRIGNGYVTCDSAGAQQILELCRLGVRALPSRKGPGSKLYGIQWLQGYDIIVDYRCKNFIKEISNYRWNTDKHGNPTDMPVDGNDHLMDALRYASEPIQHGTATAGIRF